MPSIDYTYQGTTYTNVYAFMYWQSITDTSSDQYKLKIDSGMNFDSEGFGKIDNCYVIACTDPADNGGMFGSVGDYIDWVLANGTALHTVVGDTKSGSDPNWIPLGHVEGSSVSVIEFIVNKNNWGKDNPGTSSNHPEWAGQLQSWEKVGNYWGERPAQNVPFYNALTENQLLYHMYLMGSISAKRLWDYETHKSTGREWRLGFVGWRQYTLYCFLHEMQTHDNGKVLYNALNDEWKALSNDKGNVFFDAWPANKGTFTDSMAENWVSAVAANGDDAVKYQEWYWCIRESNNIYDGIIGMLRRANLYLGDATGTTLPDDPTLDEIKGIYYICCMIRTVIDKAIVTDVAKLFVQGVSLQSLNGRAQVTLAKSTGDTSLEQTVLTDMYNRLADWDGETLPDNGFLSGFGHIGGYGENGNGTAGGSDDVTAWSSQVKYIDFYGNQLILHGNDGSKLQFYKTNADVWYPVKGSGSTSSGDAGTANNKPYDPDAGTGDPNYTQIPVFDALKKIYLDNEGKYGYSTGTEDPPLNYKDPRVDGVTNCSAFITWVATQIAPGSDMADSGYYTGVMAGMGESIANGSGGQFPYNLARPGDVLLLNHNGYNPDYDHVELFMGTESQGNDTGSELWGAGSAPCPHRNYSANALINNGYWSDWQIRRISWGE